MIQQSDFVRETGIPRWGCMFMCLVWSAFRVAENREPTMDEVMQVYHDCLVGMTPKWVNGVQVGEVPVLEVKTPATFEIYVNNPTRVVELALSYTSNGWRGGQVPDADLTTPQHMPRDYRTTFTLLNFRRASADGHWVLGDRSGMNVVYNPDENLEVDWWSRAPKWRSLKYWRV